MADVRIVIGRKYEVMQDERREATADFARWLRSLGLSVDIEVIEYEPRRRGLTPGRGPLVAHHVVNHSILNTTGLTSESTAGADALRPTAACRAG
jgi:hypothetical protein